MQRPAARGVHRWQGGRGGAGHQRRRLSQQGSPQRVCPSGSPHKRYTPIPGGHLLGLVLLFTIRLLGLTFYLLYPFTFLTFFTFSHFTLLTFYSPEARAAGGQPGPGCLPKGKNVKKYFGRFPEPHTSFLCYIFTFLLSLLFCFSKVPTLICDVVDGDDDNDRHRVHHLGWQEVHGFANGFTSGSRA